MSYIKRYWAEIVVIGIIALVLLADAAPAPTWVNTDSDGIHYLYSATNLYPAHHTSAPLFLLLGHLFLYIPFGNEFWRLSLLSVCATTISTVFVYLSIRHHLSSRAYGLLGAIIFGGSALVISQSTIVETYALITMCAIGAYYFSLKKRWWLCSIMLGAGLAIHTLGVIPIILIMLFNVDFRCWEYAGVIALFLLFYLYIPITTLVNHPPDMWGNITIKAFVIDNYSTTLMLLGGLSIWDLPKRILDTIGILGVSLGLAVVPIATMFKPLKTLLLWLFILPILFFMTNLAYQTVVYCMPSVAFGAILAVIGLSKMPKFWTYAVAIVAVGLLIFNANYFDIGRTLDKDLSANKFYTQELAKVPDGEILMPQYGWEWASIIPFNKREGRNIIAVDVDTVVSPVYQQYLIEQGIKFEDNFDKDSNTRQSFIATSIVKLNDNVWTTVTTDAETYGAEVVLAKDNLKSVNKMPTEPPAQWHWKPSNPFGYITGSIEINEWKFITWSNWNCLFFSMWIAFGLFASKMIWKQEA